MRYVGLIDQGYKVRMSYALNPTGVINNTQNKNFNNNTLQCVAIVRLGRSAKLQRQIG